MPAGPHPNTHADSRRDGHASCRPPASHRPCHGAQPRRPTTRPARPQPPAPGCALPHAESRSRRDRGASRNRAPTRCRDEIRVGPRLRRQAPRVADAKRPPHPQTSASPCATLQPRQAVSSKARRARHRAHPTLGRFAWCHARSPRAQAAPESARHAARRGATRLLPGRPPSVSVAARTIQAGESTRRRQRRRPPGPCATDAAPPRRHFSAATGQSGSPPPSSLNASRSPGWQSR